MLAAVIISLVVGAVVVKRLGQHLNQGIYIRFNRIGSITGSLILVRSKWSGQEVTIASKIMQFTRIDELKYDIAVVQMT